jgi:hypothetical protein
MRPRFRIMVVLAALTLPLLSSCDPDTPTTKYDCACTVTCTSDVRSQNVTVCEAKSAGDAAKSDAEASCGRDTHCSCSCSCSENGDC